MTLSQEANNLILNEPDNRAPRWPAETLLP